MFLRRLKFRIVIKPPRLGLADLSERRGRNVTKFLIEIIMDL
jgi:hypothetical protein